MKLIISTFDDYMNIFHIFSTEVYTIMETTKGKRDYIILLKKYVDSQTNRWRFDILKSIYKDVYINKLPDNIKSQIETTHYIDKFKWWIVNPHKFLKYEVNNMYIDMMKNVVEYYNKEHTSQEEEEEVKKVTIIERKNNRILYDYETGKPFSVLIKEQLELLNVPFEIVCFDDKPLEYQVQKLRNTFILISVHGAANTNLIFMNPGSYLFEINFRKYWFCDPVCKRHMNNTLKYTDKCDGKLTFSPEFHKADYYNLSQVFNINYKEYDIKDANTYLDNNPISLKNIYVDTDKILDNIKILYEI
jgi:hypothetical protein